MKRAEKTGKNKVRKNLKEIKKAIRLHSAKRIFTIVNEAKRDFQIIKDFRLLQKQGIRTDEIFILLSNIQYNNQILSEKAIAQIVYLKYKTN